MANKSKRKKSKKRSIRRIPYVTIRQASEILGVPESTLRTWIYRGYLRRKKSGKYSLIPLIDVKLAKMIKAQGLPMSLLPALRRRLRR